MRLQLIALTSAILALVSPDNKIQIAALSIGSLSGSACYLQERKKPRVLTDAEIKELAVNSACRQLEEYEQERLANIEHLYQTWESDAASIEADLDTIAAEREAQINNLNKQLESLESLLDDQLEEIERKHQDAIQELEKTLRQKQAEVEKELAAKEDQLKAIASEDEAWVNQEVERLTAELEDDKREFLTKYEKREEKLNDRIEFLEQELSALQWQLRHYEQPQLPEGVEQDQIAARRVIEILHSLGVTTDYRGSWLDAEYIYVRVRPRTGGLKQITKWLDRIMIELALAEKPSAELVPGAIQLFLKPRTFLPMDVTETPMNPVTGNQSSMEHPEVPCMEAIATLNASYLRDFVEPQHWHTINGAITQLELDWFNYLWNFLEPRPIRNQKAIIYRIWGKKSGDGSGFITARGRMHRIALLLKIELKRG